MSQLFVRGVRRWFAEEGRASVTALLVLLPMLTLFGAGYEAYALGVVKRSAALISGEGKSASAKPLMKPFAALIVELHHRKQRQELAAALAGDNDRAAQPDKPGEAENTEAAAAQPVAAEATPSAATPATGRRAKAGHKRKTAMTSNPATRVDSPQLTAAAIQAPADTPEAAMARWVGDVGQATPTTLAIAAKPQEELPQPRAQEPARKQVPAPAQISEPWDPLRRIEDVNEIHVAIAASFAALMFVVGLWSGRRARRAVPAVIAQAPAAEPAARADAPSAAPELPDDFEPEEQAFEAEQPWEEPAPQPARRDFQTPVAPAPATGPHYDEASFADLTSPGFSPTDDPLALPDAFEGSVPPAPSRREPDTLPSLPPGGLAPKPAVSLEDANQWPEWTAAEPAPAQPAANDNAAARPAAVKEQPKPARKRAAGAARGGIQEEMVVRRRSDARRDD